MGTMASRPALSAIKAAARLLAHVGCRSSGTNVMLAIVLVQKVPSFSLLSLKIGFVGLVVTANILPEFLRLHSGIVREGAARAPTSGGPPISGEPLCASISAMRAGFQRAVFRRAP